VPYARAYLDAIDDDDADREDIRVASDWLVLCYDAELPDPWQPEEVLGSLRLAERLGLPQVRLCPESSFLDTSGRK